MDLDVLKLSKSRLFEGFTPDDVVVVLRACEERLRIAGEDLFVEGEPGGSIFIIQAGKVEVYKHIVGDVDRVLETLGSSDVLGEVTFIDAAARSASARTVEPSEFFELTRQGFERVRQERPVIAATFFRNIANILGQRLRTTTELYKDSVAFAMDAVGAASLNLKILSEELRRVRVSLSGGGQIEGRLIQVDHHPAGYSIIIKNLAERLVFVPYHAVQCIEPM